MPVLPNPRHERFAQELAKGTAQIKAYENAGYSPDRGAACRLSAKAYISQRVVELQSMAAARIVKEAVNKDYVLKQAVRLHETAMSHLEGPEGFNAAAGNVASRALGQVGDHVDVAAFAKQQDINLHVTVDAALSRLDSVEAIEGDYEDVTLAADV